MQVAAGAPGAAGTAAVVAAVPEAFGRLADHMPPLFAMVSTRPGAADLTTAPVLQHPTRPVAVLLGAPAVRALRIEPALPGAVAAGRPRLPALIVPVDGWAGVRRLAEMVRDAGAPPMRA